MTADSCEQVSSGNTGHAEAVRIRFNPAQVSYDQLLQVFFKVAQNTAQQLTASHAFAAPIVTHIVPLEKFYEAEKYHQNYLARHPYQPYIVIHDLPKLEQLRQQFPALYR